MRSSTHARPRASGPVRPAGGAMANTLTSGRSRARWRIFGVAPTGSYNAVLVAAGFALWSDVVRRFDTEPLIVSPAPWWALALVFYLAEAYVVHVQLRREAHNRVCSARSGSSSASILLSPGGPARRAGRRVRQRRSLSSAASVPRSSSSTSPSSRSRHRRGDRCSGRSPGRANGIRSRRLDRARSSEPSPPRSSASCSSRSRSPSAEGALGPGDSRSRRESRSCRRSASRPRC